MSNNSTSNKYLIFISGGEAYSHYEDFLADLRTQTLNPFKENIIRWTDTLAEDLGAQWKVLKPKMPNSENAHYAEWRIWFERHLQFVESPLTLVGWSLGGMFLLKYLSENAAQLPCPVKHVVFLAAPVGPLPENSREDGGDFNFELARVKQIQNIAPRIDIMHSTDNPVVPYEHAVQLHDFVSRATLHTFADKNHFLVENFPELIQILQN